MYWVTLIQSLQIEPIFKCIDTQNDLIRTFLKLNTSSSESSRKLENFERRQIQNSSNWPPKLFINGSILWRARYDASSAAKSPRKYISQESNCKWKRFNLFECWTKRKNDMVTVLMKFSDSITLRKSIT